MDKEYRRHRNRVFRMEWKDVQAEARKSGLRLHLGRVFGIATLKHSEPP